MNKRMLIVEFMSEQEMDLDYLIEEIHSVIFNADNTGIEQWEVTEAEGKLLKALDGVLNG